MVHDWTVLRWTGDGAVCGPVREEPVSGCHPGERHTCADDQVSGSPWQL